MKHLNRLLEIAGLSSVDKDNNNSKMFAILDTAIDNSLYKKLTAVKVVKECLFDQAEENQLESVAPYLLELDPADSFLNWMAEDGFGKSWGIFLTSKSDIKTLAAHYKGLTTARDPEGKVYSFRYYDPRILSVYFPVCNSSEKDHFLGPAERAIVEDSEKEKWSVFIREISDVCFGI